MTLSTKLFCASISYQRLDERALANLHAAHLEQSKELLESFRVDLGLEVDSIAIIEKCNALILFISYQDDIAMDLIKGRIMMTWELRSRGGILGLMRDVKFYQDIDALKFLGECAVGIHSVTTGDSQVLSQVVDGLDAGLQNEKNILSVISGWLSDIEHDVRLGTDIFSGNTSLERLACELAVKSYEAGSEILLIGYGRSGKLISKILNTEHSLPLHIINRSPVLIKDTDLDGTNVTVSNFDEALDLKRIRIVIVAIESNTEARAAVRSLLSGIAEPKRVLFIDLSTPSVLKGNIDTCIDVEQLSELAQKNSEVRKTEVNKARTIITKKIVQASDAINKNIAKIYINDQRKVAFKKLDEGKLELVRQRSEMFKVIRGMLENRGFSEVTTPYIVGISTDPPKVDKGGTIDVQWLNGASAFLRQSNQIYKQILVASGMHKIYEIGPFWRREDIDSYRHLQESIGLDIEIKEPRDLNQLYLLACEIIGETYRDVSKSFHLKAPLTFPEPGDIPVLTYYDSVKLLQEHGNPATVGDDLGLVSEAKLGQIIKHLYNSDIFVIKDYPDTIKKFYTKNKPGGLTETFDVIVDGWELVSGAIRQTNADQIRRSMALSGIDAANYEFYLSIVDNAVQHGGFCLGLDRLMAKILGKELISEAVLFPRTYKRLVP